jgi:hypothetical protein
VERAIRKSQIETSPYFRIGVIVIDFVGNALEVEELTNSMPEDFSLKITRATMVVVQ